MSEEFNHADDAIVALVNERNATVARLVHQRDRLMRILRELQDETAADECADPEKVTSDPLSVSSVEALIAKWREDAKKMDFLGLDPALSNRSRNYMGIQVESLRKCADELERALLEARTPQQTDKENQSLREGSTMPVPEPKATPSEGVFPPGGDTPSDQQNIAAFREWRRSQAGWREIETAPKDGTWILASKPSWTLPEVVQWSGYSDCWQSMDGEFRPTHWMPLPAPPPLSDRGTRKE